MKPERKDDGYIKSYAYKFTQRDLRNNCSVGSILELNDESWIVAISTPLFIYIVSQKGKYIKLSWRQWKALDKSSCIHFKWNKKVIKTIKSLKEVISIEHFKRKETVIVRKPVIKRFPVKKKKRNPKRITKK